MMLNQYRREKFLSHLSEYEFMQYVARLSNTSIDQLAKICCDESSEDFSKTISRIACIMDSSEKKAETDNESELSGF